MNQTLKLPSVARPNPTSVRFSKRDLLYIEALIEQDYGENVTDVVRQALWAFIRQAQKDKALPSKSVRPAADIPAPEDDDPSEAA